MMTTTASHPRLTEEGRHNVFRLIGRDDVQGRLAADLLAGQYRHGRIAILHDGSTYGAGLAAEVRRGLRRARRGGGAACSLPAGAGRLLDPRRAASCGRHRRGLYRRLRAGCGTDRARTQGARRQAPSWWVGTRWAWPSSGSSPVPRARARSSPAGPMWGRRTAGCCTSSAPGVSDGVRPASPPMPRSRSGRRRRSGPAPSILSAVTETLHRGRFETVLGRVAFDAKGDLKDAGWRWQVWTNGDYEPLTSAVAMGR